MRDLPAIKLQLEDLFSIGPYLSPLEAKMTATAETLGLALSELRKQHVALNRHVAALEVRLGLGAADEKLCRLEARLEALEHINRSSELILLGVEETPSKNLRVIINNISNALGVEMDLNYIIGCFRILANRNRHPLIVKLSLPKVWNRLLAGRKSMRRLLDRSMMLGLQAGTITISKRPPPTTWDLFAETRGAARDGRLHRAWVRDECVYVRKHRDVSLFRLCGRKQLALLVEAKSPPASSAGHLSRISHIIVHNISRDTPASVGAGVGVAAAGPTANRDISRRAIPKTSIKRNK